MEHEYDAGKYFKHILLKVFFIVLKCEKIRRMQIDSFECQIKRKKDLSILNI